MYEMLGTEREREKDIPTAGGKVAGWLGRREGGRRERANERAMAAG